jgi:hypothetical protein
VRQRRRAARRREGPGGASGINIDRLICGLAAPYEQPAVDDGTVWPQDSLRCFAESAIELPLKWSHAFAYVPAPRRFGSYVGVVQEPLDTIGRAFRFASVTGEGWSGMLALAEVDEGDWHDGLLAMIRRREVTGLSLGSDATVDFAWPTELSIGLKPAFDSARIVGVGEAALSRWELLTGEPAAAVGANR